VRAERAISLAVLALIAVAIHAPRAHTDFSYDDYDFVLNNAAIRSPQRALDSFAEPFPPHLPDRGIYRPVTNLSYALDYQLWQLDGRGFHWTNVALYALVVGLVFALARFHDPAPGFAFAVAALFAVHPVHCEAVDSVTGRSELLAASFVLVSILAFARAAQHCAGSHLTRALPLTVSAAAAYALGAFSKEVGAVLPGVLAVYFLCYGRRPDEPIARWSGRGTLLLAPFAAVALAYFAARWHALGWLAPEQGMLDSQSFAFRMHTIGMSWLQYMRQLVAPATLHVDYYWDQFFQRPRHTFAAALAGCVLLAAALLAFAALIGRALRAPRSSGERTLLCGFSFVAVFLLPVMHVLPTLGWMSERYLFLPSVGFCLLVVLGVREVLRRIAVAPHAQRVAAGVLLVIVIAAGGVRSHQRALEWRDELLLWTVEDAARPNDARILTNLSLVYARRGQTTEAADALRRARAAEPRLAVLDRILDSIEDQLRASRGGSRPQD